MTVRDTPYMRDLREMASRAVYGRWHIISKPVDLDTIFLHVLHEAKIADAQGQWPHSHMPIKRTVDRRVNEATDPKFYNGDPPPLRMVSPGLYVPNPARFTGEEKRLLEEG